MFCLNTETKQLNEADRNALLFNLQKSYQILTKYMNLTDARTANRNELSRLSNSRLKKIIKRFSLFGLGMAKTKQWETEAAKYRQAIETYDLQIHDLITEANKYIHVLPSNYQYPLAAEYIYHLILNKHAHSMQEAINMFEDQLHKWELKNNQAEFIKIQQQKQRAMADLLCSPKHDTSCKKL